MNISGFGVCNQAFIPVRQEPDDRSQMVTQILFGEQFRVTEHSGNYSRIILDYDAYQGWVDKKSISFLSEEAYHQNESAHSLVTRNSFLRLLSESGTGKLIIGAGSTLRIANGYIEVEGERYHVPQDLKNPEVTPIRESLLAAAADFEGVPYLWGGRSSFGTDCSGFVQNVYKQVGIKIPRDASMQALHGVILSFLNETMPGDLAFFDNENGEIIHVGLILGGGRIIHASGKVRTDRLDHQGIYKVSEQRYTHRLRLIKRFIEE